MRQLVIRRDRRRRPADFRQMVVSLLDAVARNRIAATRLW
jgi:hypothetical protein